MQEPLLPGAFGLSPLQVNTILQGDSLAKLKELPAECMDCVITSPPYWALRDYKVEGQLGLEPTFNEYLAKLLAIFDEVKRVLKKTGTVWVNLGDTYSGTGAGGGDFNKMGKPDGRFNRGSGKQKTIQNKSLLAIPDRFKIAMIDRGWICRNEIIWYKRNCMPSSAKDRFTVDFEKVFFFTKSERYYFETQYEPYTEASLKEMTRLSKDSSKLKEPDKYTQVTDIQGGHKATASIMRSFPKFGGNKAAGYGNPTYSGDEWQPAQFGRLKRCVWDITTKGFPDAHFATFPEDLVSTPIKAGCPEWVCKKCGKPREPQWEPTEEYKKLLGKSWTDHKHDSDQGMSQEKDLPAPQCQQYEIKGLSDCGCGVGFDAGVVLDPFFGSGTVGLVALKLARNFLGIELNGEYIKMAEKRLAPLLAQERLQL